MAQSNSIAPSWHQGFSDVALRPRRAILITPRGPRLSREVWRRNEGRYTPIIADGQRVYFTGLGHLYGLEPTR